MKKILFIFSALNFLTTFVFSLTPLPGMRGVPSNLPDISVVGDFYTEFSKNYNNMLTIRGIEVAFQGYIYPEMRADIFLALHRHNNSLEFELCEGYVSFLKIFNNFSLELGKRHVDFGKINKVHQHHRPYFDQPEVVTEYLGEHGFVAEGVSLIYLLPVNFFAQVSVGGWVVPEEEHHHQENEPHLHHSFLNDKAYNSKLWLSFPITSLSELELGLNFAKAKGPHYKEHKDELNLYNLELTYKYLISTYKKLTLQTENFYLYREIPLGTLNRFGGYLFCELQTSKYWRFAVRFDYVEKPQVVNESDLSEKETSQASSFIITRELTETTLLRAQYKYDFKNSEHIGYLQMIFGFGPHSHTLE